MAQRTGIPSDASMRLACEALHTLFQAPNTPPNDAQLAFLLLHDIGTARSSGLMAEVSQVRELGGWNAYWAGSLRFTSEAQVESFAIGRLRMQD